MDRKKSLTSLADDVALELFSFPDSVFARIFATRLVVATEFRQLLLPYGLEVLLGVVFRRGDDASVFRGNVRDNVAPTFVIVDAHSDDEGPALAIFETHRAAVSAATHGEDMAPVGFVPSTALSVFPDRLLNAAEVRGQFLALALVQARGDGVESHSGRN